MTKANMECNLDVWMTNAHQSQLPDVPSALIPTNNIIPTSFALVVQLMIFLFMSLNTTSCHGMCDIGIKFNIPPPSMW